MIASNGKPIALSLIENQSVNGWQGDGREWSVSLLARLLKPNCTATKGDKESTHCKQDRRVTIIANIQLHIYKTKLRVSKYEYAN